MTSVFLVYLEIICCKFGVYIAKVCTNINLERILKGIILTAMNVNVISAKIVLNSYMLLL